MIDGVGRAAGGAVRVFAQTARGLALDLVSATARCGEAAVGMLSGGPAEDRGTAGTVGTPDTAGPPGQAVRSLSTLRVRVLILSDEQGVPLTGADVLTPALRLADRVFTEGAGIRVRCTEIRTVSEPAPTSALDPRADRGLLRDEILGRTAFYRRHLPPHGPLSVVGDPVTVIVVRDIAGRATGCSLGVTADWVVVQASLFDPAQRQRYDETVLAHELGHALNLPHHRDPANLMSGISSPPTAIRGAGLARWQAAVLQANRHTVPPLHRPAGADRA